MSGLRRDDDRGGAVGLADGGVLFHEASDTSPSVVRAFPAPDGGAYIATSRGNDPSLGVEAYYAPFLIKLGPDRHIVWAKSFAVRQDWSRVLLDAVPNPDGGVLLAAASNGLVDRGGWTGRDYAVVAVAVGGDGTYYAVGHDGAAGGLGPAVLRAFSPDGALLRATTLNGLDMPASGRLMAPRPGGGVVVGSEYDPERSYSTTPRVWSVDIDGGVRWTAAFGGGNHPSVNPTSLTVAPDGSVYVTASSTNYDLGSSVVLAYGPDGAERWSSVSGEGPRPPSAWIAEAYPVASALAPGGDLVVFGHRQEDGEGLRPFLVRYGPDGTVRWSVRGDTRPYPLPLCSTARAFGVEVGQGGEVYTVSGVGGPFGSI